MIKFKAFPDLDLRFSTDGGSTGNPAGSGETFSDVDDRLLTQWQVGVSPAYDTDADVTFFSQIASTDYFHAVSLKWEADKQAAVSIIFENANDLDAVTLAPSLRLHFF